MKTSGTLQSIRSIASSQSADGSRVGFNRFTGKAIVMGSSGSRFGLVSWVRKLYATSSDKKIQKFLMDGIAKEHRDTVGLGTSCQGKLAPETLQLRTVSDLRQWNEVHQSLIGQKRSPNVTEVLGEVTILMNKFNETPDEFVETVSFSKYLRFRLLSISQKRADACKQPSTESGGRVEQKEVPKGAKLYGLFPRQLYVLFPRHSTRYRILKSVQESLQSQGMPLNGIPSDLSAYVRYICTNKKVADPHRGAVTTEGVAKDCFHQWLNGKFIDECRACETQLSVLAQEDANIDLMFPERDNAKFSCSKNLETRVRGLLDTHYSTKGGEGSSEEAHNKAVFHEALREDTALRENTWLVLKDAYISYNTSFGKTIYSAKFLNHLTFEQVNKDQRSKDLDEYLLHNLNLQYETYKHNLNEPEQGSNPIKVS